MLKRFTDLYPVWMLLTTLVAFFWPQTLIWFHGNLISGALMVVMLGMGMTLTVDDFRRLLQMPGSVTFGFGLQYTTMPILAWILANVLQLEPGLAVGLILLGSCPGGTASNVIAYLAGADVALSVVVTMVSTFLAFIFTPMWCQLLAGQFVAVDAIGLCISTFLIIVMPVMVGVFLNWRFPKAVQRVSWLGPILSVIAICLITGGIVSSSVDLWAAHALRVAIAVTLLHIFGFIVGYVVSRITGHSERIARTISIEVGMQNGGMAAVMARNHFAAHPLATLPAVFSALIQNLMGSLLAAWWRQSKSAADDKQVVEQSLMQASSLEATTEGLST
ncbi:bile acid:sodium symporter family protein [Lacunimicrobium album]